MGEGRLPREGSLGLHGRARSRFVAGYRHGRRSLRMPVVAYGVGGRRPSAGRLTTPVT
jgi:hypothetical protein